MKCKNCGKETGQIKAGKTRALRQKYKCKHCGKVYTPNPNERVEVIEMDGLYSFVERKNRIYVMTLVSRDKRQIVGYDIAFDKSRERIQQLVDRSPKALRYYSDTYPLLGNLL